ncbi:MAG: glycosyltransferase family 4 protein [Actinomycetota bacterium]|nr:glycosyltransferase family 4 protein [Actinomycetota bacterium]
MRPLSVALLSWEYPPVVVGGLARHVYELGHGLVAEGHEVTVYTRGRDGSPPEEDDGGVRVIRVSEYPPPIGTDELVPWTLAFNIALVHRAERDLRLRAPDVLHAHDWLVAYAAAVLKDLDVTPLVATIHATEHGRHGGRLPGPTQRFIHRVERWLVAEAERVVTCSAYMREQVARHLGADEDRLETIANEVDVPAFAHRGPSVRAELWREDRPLLLFAGRLEYEKGLQTLLDALPLLDGVVPGAGLVVAGDGTYRSTLEELSRSRALGHRVRFEGFVGEDRLHALYAAADVAVVPSLYEPFGLVALEAMASGTPLVASDTGGLREIVVDEISGLRFRPGDAEGLARAVARVLLDPETSARLQREAHSALAARRSWTGAAARTAEAYRKAIDTSRRAPTPLRTALQRSGT